MPIDVQCQCGKHYRVKDELAGRRVRCKACSGQFVVPSSVIAEPVIAEPAPEARAVNLADQFKMEAELKRSREQSQSAASNPGMFRVSYLRHFLAFPKWALIWHSLLLISLVLTIAVHWGFGVLVLLFAYAVYLYWHRVKYQFISGCVNPGVVVSTSPPLVAVLTDLSKGWQDCPVVKVLPQPLSRMAGGMPAMGTRVATVAFYHQLNEGLAHWDDFSPVVAGCVTANEGDIARVLASIEASDWQELDDGLRQIPKPVCPGLYRVYTVEALNRPLGTPANEIPFIVEQHLAGQSNCFFSSNGIRPEVLRQVRTYVSAEQIRQVTAVVETAKVSSDAKEGFAFVPSGVLYHFEKLGQGEIPWEQLAGALGTDQGLELTFRAGSRLLIPKTHFLSGTRVALENMFNAIVRGE